MQLFAVLFYGCTFYSSFLSNTINQLCITSDYNIIDMPEDQQDEKESD